MYKILKTTRAVEYNDSTLAKVDLDSKQLSNTSVVVEYKIRVTNEGEVAGYIKRFKTMYHQTLNLVLN